MDFKENTTSSGKNTGKYVNIFIVDDNDFYRDVLEKRFARSKFDKDTSYATITANSARNAMEKVGGNLPQIDAFIIDIRMETDDAGITLIEYIRRKDKFRFVPIVVITGQPGEYSEKRIRKEYLIHGYINKSDNVDVLEEVKKIILAHKKSQLGELQNSRIQIEEEMGSCQRMQEVFEQAENCSRIKHPVIYIDGETGTGKSLIAEYFHQISPGEGIFVGYNCSLPVGTDENILKSILFGARKGFLSADHKGNDGLIAQAENGTLFLDEFQHVSLEIQAMLIKVIENREYRPLGSEEIKKCKVTFLIAGNKNIKTLLEEKRIREDFYYRIHDIIHVPSLRERRSDIPHFIDKFLRDSTRSLRKYVSISEDAREKLEKYSWPGNVRQLKNVIERAVLHCKGFEITVRDIRLEDFDQEERKPVEMVSGNFYADLKSLIQSYLDQNKNIVAAKNPKEREVLIDFDEYKMTILDVFMGETNNNQKATAELLGISVEQLRTLLKKFPK